MDAAHALLSLRLEKSWGMWTMEYRPDFNAIESGMDAFINWNKNFVGKEATLKARDEGVSKKLVTMVINTHEIDVSGDEAILKEGAPIGYISSGGYGHHVGKSIAMGYVKAECADAGTILQVEILGSLYMQKCSPGQCMTRMGLICILTRRAHMNIHESEFI